MMSASKSTATPQPAAQASGAEGDWIEVKSKRTKPKKDAPSPSANGKANPKQAGGASKADTAASGTNAQKGRKEATSKGNQSSKDTPASPKGQASGDDQSGSKPQKRKNFAQPADDALKEKWLAEVQELKSKLILKNDFNWKLVLPETDASVPAGEKSNPGSWANLLFRGQQAAPAAEEPKATSSNVNALSLIGGLDLSYMKGDNKRPVAVAALVVCAFPSLEVVYQSVREVKVDEPYLSGFLSFREVPHFLALLNELKESKPELMPQLLIVDGNGLLHQKGFGLACHLGVLANLPTIGVAKKLFSIDGINEQTVRLLTAEQPLEVGEAIELRGRSGAVHGAMMQTKPAGRAIFLSVGHRISLKTAVDVVRECCPKTKLPVPVEVADIKSREEVANVEARIAEAIQRRKEKKAQYEAQREQRLAENAQRRKERDQQRKERGTGGSPKENGANKGRGSPRGNFDRTKGQQAKNGATAAGARQGNKPAAGAAGRAPIPGQQIRLAGAPKPLATTTQPATAAGGATTTAPAQQTAATTATAAAAPAQQTSAAAPAAATTSAGAGTSAAAGSPTLAPSTTTTTQAAPQGHAKAHAAKVPQGNKAQQQGKGQPQKGKQLHQPSKQN